MDTILMMLKEVWEMLFSAVYSSAPRISVVIASMGTTVLLCTYIFFIYRLCSKTGFYSRNFNKTIALMGVITGAIVLAMQTNVFISLGMIGALSIIRFRNVVKDPYDLTVLYWSIATGILCGAGLYLLAFLLAAIITVGVFLLDFISMPKAPYLLVINSTDKDVETALTPIVKKHAKTFRVKSRNLTNLGVDLILELRTESGQQLVAECGALSGVTSVALLSHDGELRA